jgi:cytochrome c-type biogenesis protein CcmE
MHRHDTQAAASGSLARGRSGGGLRDRRRDARLPVTYKGLLPDLFREGQGVVAEEMLDGSGVFRADTVLAKHDEIYMPREVADA